MSSFTAKIDDWVLETEQRLEAVFKESTQRTINEMQLSDKKGGNMPIDTGFLKGSLQTSLHSPVIAHLVNPYTEKNSAPEWDASEASLVILNAEIGDTIFAVYGANYARYVEYGSNGRPGKAFVRQAAAKWQTTVSQVALDLQRSVSQK